MKSVRQITKSFRTSMKKQQKGSSLLSVGPKLLGTPRSHPFMWTCLQFRLYIYIYIYCRFPPSPGPLLWKLVSPNHTRHCSTPEGGNFFCIRMVTSATKGMADQSGVMQTVVPCQAGDVGEAVQANVASPPLSFTCRRHFPNKSFILKFAGEPSLSEFYGNLQT